jgi:tRNA(fMet)-specific endonuclease VapC
MTHLLDTNTCVEYLRRGSTGSVASHLAAKPPGSVVLCSVVVAELLFGALRSRDPIQVGNQVRTFCLGFRSLPFEDTAADHYDLIRNDLTNKGSIIGPNDLMIAAIALANHLVLVTHNTREFGRVPGLTLEDWQTP